MADGDLGDLLEDRTELDVLQREVTVLRHEVPQLLLERRQVDVAALILAGQHQHDVAKERDVLLPEGHQQEHQELPDLRSELPDHAEVQEVDLVVPPQQVPRVRVRVEEPVGHDLAVVGLEQLTGRLRAGLALRGLADGDSLDLFHRQQPRGRELLVDLWHVQARIGPQHLAHAFDVAGLLVEIQLALQRGREVLEDRPHVDDLAKGRAVRGLADEDLEETEVAHDVVPSSRPLHLHHDPLAPGERGPVDLGDGARCHRIGDDALEHVLPRDAQLLLHHGHHFLLGERGDVVLERGELFHEGRREQVRAGRKNLPELGECGT